MSEASAFLSERAQAMLDFEREWVAHQGRKDAEIRSRFGVSAARYYHLLARVIELPAAVAYDPFTTKRLRRRRQERERQRTARLLEDWPGR
ncbi:MAG: DUF3263 domain-containing protein [Egibacteraceae bacterium]